MQYVRSLLALATLLTPVAAELLSSSERVDELVFVSCFKERRPAPAFDAIASISPGLFLWMGDNVYGDTEDMQELRSKYQVARNHPAYMRIRAKAQVTGTWDDHDYGANDAGKEYPMKAESQQVFLDFMDVPADSPRRKRQGVYSASDYGPAETRLRVISLDTRYFRDPIGSDGALLGEDQWTWLEKMLTESKAQVNVLVSSIQVLASEHRWEKWENFPKEKKRLFTLLARPDVPPVVILSGDRHMAEISVEREVAGYPLYDVTSSSLNTPLGRGDEPNQLREGELFRLANFGTLSIDWGQKVPQITARIRDEKGQAQREACFTLKR